MKAVENTRVDMTNTFENRYQAEPKICSPRNMQCAGIKWKILTSAGTKCWYSNTSTYSIPISICLNPLPTKANCFRKQESIYKVL